MLEKLKQEEIPGEYKKNTGTVIVKTFAKLDANTIPGVLVNSHGPFAWGCRCDGCGAQRCCTGGGCLHGILYYTRLINPDASTMQQELLDKHYLRKHGEDAYYGQKGSNVHGL